MRAFASVLALVLVITLPIAASAQQRAPAPQPQQQDQGVPAGKILAIGIGVVLGAVVLDSLLVAEAAPLVGGIVGGFVGAWWYNTSGDTMPRVSIRHPGYTPAAVRQVRLEPAF